MLLPGTAAPLPVVSLYADDTTVIALSDCVILEVFQVYARFEAATGSRLYSVSGPIALLISSGPQINLTF